MARTTTAEKREAEERLREALRACGPDGNETLQIIDDGGRPSSSGRTHKLQVITLGTSHGTRPVTMRHLTYNVARALGLRLSNDEQILMGGYGYSRSLELAASLSRLCGHPLYCESTGAFAGATGWVGEKASSP